MFDMLFCRQDTIESTFDVQKNSELPDILQGEQNLESWHSPHDLIALQWLYISISVNSSWLKAPVLFTATLSLIYKKNVRWGVEEGKKIYSRRLNIQLVEYL